MRFFENLGDMRFGMSRSLPASLSTAGAWASRPASYNSNAMSTCTSPASGTTRCCATSDGTLADVTAEAATVVVRPLQYSVISTPTVTSTSTSRSSFASIPANPPATWKSFRGIPVFAGPHRPARQRDVLLENLGDGALRDVTDVSGCAQAEPSYGLGVAIVDLDGDSRTRYLRRQRLATELSLP